MHFDTTDKVSFDHAYTEPDPRPYFAGLPGGRRPVTAHFLLRMFSYEPIATCLADLGYETVGVDGLFKQRRFVSEQEQAQILDAVGATGAEPHELETQGWLCAQP